MNPAFMQFDTYQNTIITLSDLVQGLEPCAHCMTAPF